MPARAGFHCWRRLSIQSEPVVQSGNSDPDLDVKNRCRPSRKTPMAPNERLNSRLTLDMKDCKLSNRPKLSKKAENGLPELSEQVC